MTKRELISLIKNKLTGGTSTVSANSKYHPRVIEKSIEIGYNTVLLGTLEENKRFRDIAMPYLDIKAFYREVSFDSIRQQHYISAKNVLDPRFVRAISSPVNREQAFAFIDSTSEPMNFELEAFQIDQTIGAMVENENIYFDDKFPTVNPPEKLLLKMVPDFSGLGMDDEVTIPLAQLHAATMEYWNGLRPDDDINENKQLP